MDRSGTKTGMVAMFYFSSGGKNIQIEYYSTIMELYETTSPVKKFTVNTKEVTSSGAEIEANEAAEEFLKTVTCDGGTTAPSLTAWNTFVTTYASLCAESKAIFVNADANEFGSNVQRAVARYDYIVGKYNANGVVYQEFITSRKVEYFSMRNVMNEYSSSSLNYLLMFSAIAILGISSIFICKKKKQK